MKTKRKKTEQIVIERVRTEGVVVDEEKGMIRFVPIKPIVERITFGPPRIKSILARMRRESKKAK